VLAYLNGKLGNDPAAFAAGVARNIDTILTKLDAAGKVSVVVGNIPDLAVTPSMQALLGKAPGALANVTALVTAVNNQIAKVAAAHGAAMVDLFFLSEQAARQKLWLDGIKIAPDKYFAPDGFHPGTVLQGLVANSILAAFGGDAAGLRLSDQEILGLAKAGRPDPGPPTYYNVSGFVPVAIPTAGAGAAAAPEPATAVLLAIGGLVGYGVRRRRAVA
jgi:phospholipase/lecithinase/hemolysin